MKKAFLFTFYISLFCALLIGFGHVVLSIADHKFKGAVCRDIDKKECERRFKAYHFCFDTLKKEKQIDQKIAKKFCFETAFFGIDVPKDEHN